MSDHFYEIVKKIVVKGNQWPGQRPVGAVKAVPKVDQPVSEPVPARPGAYQPVPLGEQAVQYN